MAFTVDPRFMDRWVQTISDAIGNDEGRLEGWLALINLGESLKHIRPLRSFSLDGKVSLEEKVDFLRGFFSQTLGSLLPESPELLIVPLLEGNLWEALAPLKDRVEKSFDIRTGQVRVEILSAAELSVEDRKKVLETLSRFVNGAEFRQGDDRKGNLTVRPTWTVRPSLLAGLMIRIGSRVWDASLSTRIHELERQLLKSA
ncbi:MAG: F0F1 ATP synthase subunit delta [Leptospirillia bacterium]